MSIAILGAGFTGLTAALRLLQKGHQVTIFEKEGDIGGLAVGFKQKNWNWSLEKAYHHWFTNDIAVLNLTKELNYPVIIKKPGTAVLVNNELLPFDSPTSLLTFSHLSLTDRLRVGAATLYLKVLNDHKKLEGKKALEWIKKYMGQQATNLIWEPLLHGKFGVFKEDIALTWFWARIKKRTPALAYPEGGFKMFAYRVAQEIEKLGGEVKLNTEIKSINELKTFDKVIVTLPSPIFARIAKLPADYVKKITSIPHLHAQVLILTLKNPFMDKTYWLNITDKSFPFLVLAEHTNFMDSKHYGNQHILYIGNYLPPNHPYLKLTKQQLLSKFRPYLKKLNSKFLILNSYLFIGSFSQPVVTTDYPKLIPQFKTPLEEVYLANLDMVYPWDRGTNYAVEMGEKVAEVINAD